MKTTIKVTQNAVMVTSVKLVQTKIPLSWAGVPILGELTATYVAQQIIGDDASESLLAMFLDTKNQVIAAQRVFTGTVNKALAAPREILQSALLCNAVSFIMAHNQPSGDCTPSDADRQQMQAMELAGNVVGIKMLDSLVVSPEDAYSIKSNAHMA
ncbi:JAB domain-containing protein [Lacticaseibacillus daqingensis]|uniref:JAB domain-containing protein n=1 Tax=Lacticaseibacillus daqingensis TaxID=2486014 RepID=UPI000F77AFAE|nr:JAB domain-containing protein [Lacticaseibacillus daqingensis]